MRIPKETYYCYRCKQYFRDRYHMHLKCPCGSPDWRNTTSIEDMQFRRKQRTQ